MFTYTSNKPFGDGLVSIDVVEIDEMGIPTAEQTTSVYNM